MKSYLIRLATLCFFLLGIAINNAKAQRPMVSGLRIQCSEGLPDVVETFAVEDTVTGAFTIENRKVSINQVSLRNQWIGATFSSLLTGDDKLANNFVFNANVLYNIKFGEGSLWNVPVVGNVKLPVENDKQIEIGVYPWRVISETANGLTIVLHGGVGYKVTPVAEAGIDPQEIQFLVGIELSGPLSINGEQQDLPVTLSIAPSYVNSNLGTEDQYGLNGTLIFPLAGGLGVIGDLYVPFKSGAGDTMFSAGIIVNGPLGSSTRNR